jgi:hypothetical protein
MGRQTADLTPGQRYACGIVDGLAVAMVVAIVLLIAL